MDDIKYKLLTMDPYDNEIIDIYRFNYLHWYDLLPILETVITNDNFYIYKLQIFIEGEDEDILQSHYIARKCIPNTINDVIRDHRYGLNISPIHEPYVVKKSDRYIFTKRALLELHDIGINLMRLADEED